MGMQNFNTRFNGIIVKVDPAKSPTFAFLVEEALNTIYSKPVGRRMIDDIVAKGKSQFGYKVCIMRPLMVAGPNEKTGKKDWKGGSRAVRVSEENACNETGTVTMIEWNPNVIANPDGARPSFIGLAHELVHALHNLLGEALKETREEEEMTVGLNAWLTYPPNENLIRQEHHVPHRAKYESEDFGSVYHDEAQFGKLFGQT